MIIREQGDHVEIHRISRLSDGTLRAGDVEISISVDSQGFRGSGSAWIGAEHLASFVAELRQLEARREGSATIESISPGEFRLTFRSVDRRGHMAVVGRLAHHCFLGDRGLYLHAVEFGFEFDPTLLPDLLAQFAAMTEP